MHLAVKSLTAHFLDVIGLTKKETSSFGKGLKPITALPSVLLPVAMPLPIQFLNRAQSGLCYCLPSVKEGSRQPLTRLFIRLVTLFHTIRIGGGKRAGKKIQVNVTSMKMK